MSENNIFSTFSRILGAISFWLFIFTGALIVVFHNFGFETLPDRVITFWQFFSQPFSQTLFPIYNPFYFLPFFLAGLLASLGREKKKFYYKLGGIIFPIFLSLLITTPLFFGLSLCAADSLKCRKQLEIFEKVIITHLVFCLILFAIFYYKKEKIIKKLMAISLIVFLVGVGYITFSAKVAFTGKVVLEDLAQKAIQTKDFSFCEEILEEGKERKISGSLVDGTYRKCINTIASALGGESICDIYHEKEEARAECRKQVFLETTDLCKDISQKEKVKCIQKIAIETNDIELCKKILGGVKCIAPIAVNTKNLNLCFPEEINYPLPWELNPFACFKEVFKYTDNVNLCNELKYPYYKDGCLEVATLVR